MPSDDRDRQLERALARQLRSASPDPACPDAEILAAYHERTLSPEEMAQWKLHIAACSRCQETLAFVEESNIVQGSEEEKGKMMELVSARFAAGHVQVEAASPAGSPVVEGSAIRQIPKRAVALRWVVPIGALAAGLLVWVAVRENHQNSLVKKSEQVEVAANHESTRSVPPAPAAEQTQNLQDHYGAAAQPPQVLNDLRKNSTASVMKPSGAFSQRVPPVASKPVLTIPKIDTKEKKAEAQAADDLSALKTEPAPISAPTEANNYAAQTREIPLNQRAQVPAAAAPNANAANQAVSGGRLSKQQSQKAIPSSSAETVEVSGANRTSQSLNDVLPEGGVVIVAPVDAYSWRVGPGGKIEHSTDGSRTWMLQKSGVTTDLTAGSATSGKVCWVVGKAGTVLLTTDRGKHWKQLASPTKEDLVGVDAMDEKRASIWTASHTKSYDTNDGGVTWTPVVNK